MGLQCRAADRDDMRQLRLDAVAALRFQDRQEPDRREHTSQLDRQLFTQQ